jgi:NTE family protein
LKSTFRNISLLTFVVLLLSSTFAQQKVGLVLSGGGATGLAHIGVLKALEEKGIPIDYITGTSAGALVGSMYASGFSPEEIENYVLSEDFQLMITGKIKPNQHFLFREEEQNASLINLLFTHTNILKKSLPTNFISSSYLDFEMLKLLGTTGASCNNNFDSLFIPFRCVSSDITNKKSVVFSDGDLNQAVRSSMTFPFYFSPLKIKGNLLFDGGLYNNFPADIMYKEFSPDFIIGSNVTNNADAPTEDDLISQVVNMLVSHSDFTLPCEMGIIIQPTSKVKTFDFEDVKQAISDGYNSTIKYLDSIEVHIEKTISKEELLKKRKVFKAKINNLNIESVTTSSPTNKKLFFIEKSIINTKKEKVIDSNLIEKRFYRLYNSKQIDFLYPTLTKKTDSTYNLNLEDRKAKEFKLDVGGHFSSRSVNTGYIGLSARKLGKVASVLKLESYFGKFYGSAKAELTIETPSVHPVSISPYFVLNRWDYFHNFSTFFEDVRPSFLIQKEMYYGIKFNHPIKNTAKSTLDLRGFNLEDDYYQTSNYTNKDTTDKTFFNGFSSSWQFMKNTLNRKQFASSGHYFSFKIKYINGMENSISGSTSKSLPYDITKSHSWININSEIQTFLIDHQNFHLGLYAKGVLNSQSLYSNYTATLLAMTAFSPIADAETYFLPEYRSPQFIGTGFNFIFSLKKKVDLRIDTYYYQPFVRLNQNVDNGTFGYSKPFKGQTILASSSIIYHSFFGPIRITLNYFPQQKNPIAFQFSYGFAIFNERAIR